MAAYTTCDKCQHEIVDGVEVIADYLDLKSGRNREIWDYCIDCAPEGIMDIVITPKFCKMLVTKVGVHFER